MSTGVVATDVGVGSRLRGIEGDLRRLVAGLDVECLSGRDAARLVDVFVGIERLAASAKALCAARVERSGAWRADGDRSAAGWLGRKSGMPANRAAEELATGQRVAEGPEMVRDAFRAGRLSGPEASAISTATSVAPDAAGGLLRRAGRDSLQELRNECRAVTAAGERDSGEARMRRLHAGRYLRRWVDADGAGRIDARLAPDAYARVNACLRPFERELFDQARRQGRRESPEAYSADALLALAEEADHADELVAAGPSPAAATDNSASSASSAPRRRPSGASRSQPSPHPQRRRQDRDRDRVPSEDQDRTQPEGRSHPEGRDGSKPEARSRRRRRRPADAQIIYYVDYNSLLAGGKPGEETCWLEGVGPVPLSTVEAMKSDAVLSAVVGDGIDIRSVVHLGRYATAAQRTAIIARDRCCVVPGCGVRHGLEIDHVTGWTNTHVTKLDDLARLCHHHHHLKTYQHWTLTGGPGHWQFNPPDRPLPGKAPPDRSPARRPPAGQAAPGPAPAPQQTAAPPRPAPAPDQTPTAPAIDQTTAPPRPAGGTSSPGGSDRRPQLF